MNCPSCGAPAVAGQESCGSCGALLSPPTEGALAPLPAPVATPSKTEPLRHIPALQKKDKATWRDEVRERVRQRRQKRHPGGGEALPLFEEPARRAEAPEQPQVADERGPEEWTIGEDPASRADDDLPLRSTEPIDDAERDDVPNLRAGPAPRAGSRDGYTADEETESSEEWSLGAAAESRPVERPAEASERAQAGAIDAVFLAALFAIVVYFASRRAGVPVLGLRSAWPYLAGYLAFLGLFYATYFTGATGQTLGKLVVGLRVADRRGAPPSYSKAFLRAALGAFGIAAAFLGLLPMLFDPARRAFHDRVFKTRVIRG